MRRFLIVSSFFHAAALILSMLVVPQIEPKVISPPPEPKKPVEIDLMPMPADFDMDLLTAVPHPDDIRPPLPPFDPDKIAALLDKLPKDKPLIPDDVKTPKLSFTEIDSFKFQMRKCWSVPVGAKNIHKMIVRVRIFLAPDGSMLSKPVLLTSTYGKGTFFRVVAESALRAIRRCQPFKMPADKYHTWKEMVLTFSAAEMLGS